MADGNLFRYAGDDGNRIRKIDTNGLVTTVLTEPGYISPNIWQIDVDARNNVYFGFGSGVNKISSDGTVVAWSVPSGAGWVSLAVNSRANVYAAKGYQVILVGPMVRPCYSLAAISAFQTDQNASAVSGTVGPGCWGGREYLFKRWKSDSQNRCQRMGEHVGRFRDSGFPGRFFWQAQFSQPAGICVDGRGTVYVADWSNNCIRKIWIDSDGDGVPDLLERGSSTFVVGVNDRLVDSDQDGTSDAAEFWAGTNPLDPSSFLNVDDVRVLGDGHVELKWHTVGGRLYSLSYSEDLVAWKPLGDPIWETTRRGRLRTQLQSLPTANGCIVSPSSV